jgi:hypothetical protein
MNMNANDNIIRKFASHGARTSSHRLISLCLGQYIDMKRYCDEQQAKKRGSRGARQLVEVVPGIDGCCKGFNLFITPAIIFYWSIFITITMPLIAFTTNFTFVTPTIHQTQERLKVWRCLDVMLPRGRYAA